MIIAEPAVVPTANASIGKAMVLDFPLNALTDFSPLEELARITHLTSH